MLTNRSASGLENVKVDSIDLSFTFDDGCALDSLPAISERGMNSVAEEEIVPSINCICAYQSQCPCSASRRTYR